MTAYAELCVTTNFTFLTGASHPEELVTRAAELGLTAPAPTRRAAPAAADPGARMVLIDSPVEWLALPTDLSA